MQLLAIASSSPWSAPTLADHFTEPVSLTSGHQGASVSTNVQWSIWISISAISVWERECERMWKCKCATRCAYMERMIRDWVRAKAYCGMDEWKWNTLSWMVCDLFEWVWSPQDRTVCSYGDCTGLFWFHCFQVLNLLFLSSLCTIRLWSFFFLSSR